MENETPQMSKQDAVAIFASSALTGLLSANPDLAKHPNDLAKNAASCGNALAEELFPEEKSEPEENTSAQE
ncbi:MAG: hypothetical protein N4A71_10990 [Carboxylicivirga sp.]|jgi:hypothetical protein|nr:hypothetical protein [Carboxylicivirga sp.]